MFFASLSLDFCFWLLYFFNVWFLLCTFVCLFPCYCCLFGFCVCVFWCVCCCFGVVIYLFLLKKIVVGFFWGGGGIFCFVLFFVVFFVVVVFVCGVFWGFFVA